MSLTRHRHISTFTEMNMSPAADTFTENVIAFCEWAEGRSHSVFDARQHLLNLIQGILSRFGKVGQVADKKRGQTFKLNIAFLPTFRQASKHATQTTNSIPWCGLPRHQSRELSKGTVPQRKCLFRRICGYFPELNSDFVPLH